MDSASMLVACLIIATLVILTVTLLSLFVLPIKVIAEEDDMPKSPPSPVKAKTAMKTADTPADPLPFPGKLVDGKYDVHHLHL